MRNPLLATALALACACGAAPVVAKDKTDDAVQASKGDEGQAAAADGKSAKSHKICRIETVTGSVLPKRVCHTVAESDAQHAQVAATKEAQQH
jgi:hypothetical protein